MTSLTSQQPSKGRLVRTYIVMSECAPQMLATTTPNNRDRAACKGGSPSRDQLRYRTHVARLGKTVLGLADLQSTVGRKLGKDTVQYLWTVSRCLEVIECHYQSMLKVAKSET